MAFTDLSTQVTLHSIKQATAHNSSLPARHASLGTGRHLVGPAGSNSPRAASPALAGTGRDGEQRPGHRPPESLPSPRTGSPAGLGHRSGEPGECLDVRPDARGDEDTARREALAAAPARADVGGEAGVGAGTTAPASPNDHEVRRRVLPGGPVEVSCGCGGWAGVAPSVAAGDESWARHAGGPR